MKELQEGVEQRRLHDEILALAAIRSKHVVQLYDVIADDHGSVVGLVEEYLPGTDLNAIIPIADALQVLRVSYAIACGIADIHAAGCIHRDIKPANMKFDAEGCLKIFDFGLARTDPDDAATRGAVGTDGYMAPELCVHDDREVNFSQAVDTYAFAATVLKVIRGSVPAPMRQLMPAITPEADFLLQPVQLDADVGGLMNRCLSSNPALRPSMEDVRSLIGAHILRDTHRATLVAGNGVYHLNAARRTVRIALGRLGALDLGYDGLHFRVTASTGEVFVNNVQVRVPHVLPGSCVITVGGPDEGARRAHITVDVSHPEVVL